MYISILKSMGLASVKKVAPRMAFGEVKPVADEKTLEAIIANRYEVMAGYAREMRAACQRELESLQSRSSDASLMQAARQPFLPFGEGLNAIRHPFHLPQHRPRHAGGGGRSAEGEEEHKDQRQQDRARDQDGRVVPGVFRSGNRDHRRPKSLSISASFSST